MTKLKMCGIRDPDNAIVAAESGADFLGFVFVPETRRYINPDQAKEIIKTIRQIPGFNALEMVGLFANQSLTEINQIIKVCDLDYVQLCGQESLHYCEQVNANVIKQIKIKTDFEFNWLVETISKEVELVKDAGHIAMLDRYDPNALGGTGHTFNWEIAKRIANSYNIMLAGGLNPGNVADAIVQVRPWAVDVSSGIESDGVKDSGKIRDFAQITQLTDNEHMDNQEEPRQPLTS